MWLPPLTYYQAKGSNLTTEEMDRNFVTLANAFETMWAWVSQILNADGTEKNPRVYYAASATGVDDYATNLSPAPAALNDLIGKLILLKVDVANEDGLATFNPNGLGATPITKTGTVALAAADLKANQIVPLCFDGTQFQIP